MCPHVILSVRAYLSNQSKIAGILVRFPIAIMFSVFWFGLSCNQNDMLESLENPGGMIGHRVFVSSLQNNGVLNMTSGAFYEVGCTGNDFLRGICVCNYLANKAGISRATTQFLPWMSLNATIHAKCFIQGSMSSTCAINPAGPWYNMKNELVAQSLSDLISGSLKNVIRYFENGADAGATEVFTGTTYDGLGNNQDCSAWSSAGGFAYVGEANSNTATWTNKALLTCGSLRSYYCFEMVKK